MTYGLDGRLFQYSQDLQNSESYKQLPWKQYLTTINVKYIFGDRFKIPTHTYQIHNYVINITKLWGVGFKCPK